MTNSAEEALRRRSAGRHGQAASSPQSRSELRGQRTSEVRRALRLTALSTLFPGLGLVFTRRYRFGFLLLVGATLVTLVLAFLVANGGVITAAARFLTSKGLLALLALFLVGGVLWVFGIMLTARETCGRGWGRGARWLTRAFTVAMCLLVAVPAARATQYVLVTQDAFNTMFVDRFSRNTEVRGPGTGSDPWKDVPRINILLVGSDAGKGRQNTRTDSLIVASISTKTGDTTLISIPRNYEKVPFPANNPLHQVYPDGFECAGHECMMEAVWNEAAVNKPDLFTDGDPNPGLNTTVDVVGEIVGMPIDYSVVVDLLGFQQLVDAMGGVTVTVPPGPTGKGVMIGGVIKNGRIDPRSVYGYVAPGERQLTGREALWYARSRAETSDYDRMRRQRCMVNALISQTSPAVMLQKFPDIMRAAGDNITLDVPRDQLSAFAELGERMKRGNMRSVNIGKGFTDSADPDYDKVRALVRQAVDQPHDPTAPKATSTATPTPTTADATNDANAQGTDPLSPTPPTDSTSTTEPPIGDTQASC